MKIREGFISNSSSSSFIVTDENHISWKIFQEAAASASVEVYDDPGGITVSDSCDNATWRLCRDLGIEWTDFLEQTNFNG